MWALGAQGALDHGSRGPRGLTQKVKEMFKMSPPPTSPPIPTPHPHPHPPTKLTHMFMIVIE